MGTLKCLYENVYQNIIHNWPPLETTKCHEQSNGKINCGLFTQWNILFSNSMGSQDGDHL